MKIRREKIDVSIFVLASVMVGLIFAITMKSLPSFADEGTEPQPTSESSEKFVTIYDNEINSVKTIRTDSQTVADVLERAEINVDPADIVEPALSEQIASENFRINIYRAKPVVVVDGIRQYKIMTAASDPEEIAKAAGVELLEADVVKITTVNSFLEYGLPIAYTVQRAKTINFNFFGQEVVVRTGAQSVQDFLAERHIEITDDDWLSLPADTIIEDGLTIAVFRQGKNTITIEEAIDFSEQITYDYAQNIGYRAATREGSVGYKTVTYEIEMQDGKEISRTFVTEIVTKEPTSRLITIGMRAVAMKPLTKQMGRNRYTTGTGIAREETYYDLNMSVVMRNCGGGGHYSVRQDGVKIDKDGYVIVAADLGRYPRCSIVETSLGLGKVYDTGSFAMSNPEQFDIATDWTRADGI